MPRVPARVHNNDRRQALHRPPMEMVCPNTSQRHHAGLDGAGRRRGRHWRCTTGIYRPYERTAGRRPAAWCTTRCATRDYASRSNWVAPARSPARLTWRCVIGIVLATGASVLLAHVMEVPYLFNPTINLLSVTIGVLFDYSPGRPARSGLKRCVPQ